MGKETVLKHSHVFSYNSESSWNILGGTGRATVDLVEDGRAAFFKGEP